MVTTGGSEAIQFALMTLCDPGDEVIVPEPYYTNVGSFARGAMVTLVPVPPFGGRFRLPDIAHFEARITPRPGFHALQPDQSTGMSIRRRLKAIWN